MSDGPMVLENSQAAEGFRGSVRGMTVLGGCEDWILCGTFDFPLVQYTFYLDGPPWCDGSGQMTQPNYSNGEGVARDR